jgi:hypothetical protein
MCGPPVFVGALSAPALIADAQLDAAEGPGNTPELTLAGVDAPAG